MRKTFVIGVAVAALCLVGLLWVATSMREPAGGAASSPAASAPSATAPAAAPAPAPAKPRPAPVRKKAPTPAPKPKPAPAAPAPTPGAPAATNPDGSVIYLGTVKTVHCNADNAMTVNLNVGGEIVTLTSPNYMQVPFSATFTPNGTFYPCRSMPGLVAKITANGGNIQSIVVGK